MCNYCEPYKHDDGRIHVDLLYDLPSLDYMCCVIGKTPISERQHEKDGLVAGLSIYTPNDQFTIPIKFCPVCGRDLTENNTSNE